MVVPVGVVVLVAVVAAIGEGLLELPRQEEAPHPPAGTLHLPGEGRLARPGLALDPDHVPCGGGGAGGRPGPPFPRRPAPLHGGGLLEDLLQLLDLVVQPEQRLLLLLLLLPVLLEGKGRHGGEVCRGAVGRLDGVWFGVKRSRVGMAGSQVHSVRGGGVWGQD